jgi:glycosyltransferase involved in cell wall biosynthesis
MKILLISLFLPQKKASHAGGRFVFEMAKELSLRHEVHLATRVEEQELAGLDELKPFCREIYPYVYKTSPRRGLFETLSLVINYLGFSRYANKLISSDRYDLVQVEWVEAAILVTKKQTPMVLDAHDVISKPAERRYRQAKGMRRIAAYLAFQLMRNLEWQITEKFDRIIVRSEVDRVYVHALAPGFAVSIIPHPAGLDITEKTYERKMKSILFLASYKYRKTNVDAAHFFYRSVLPLVRKKIPDAEFIIAGYGPPEELLSFREKDPHVVIPGFVDDTDEYYKKASVFVAPILVGGGIIVKVLDAMAAGTPVVATTYGNEGIGAKPGQDILIADDPERFAAMVVRVISDRAFAENLGNNGKNYIREHYSKEAVFSKLESLYEQLPISK